VVVVAVGMVPVAVGEVEERRILVMARWPVNFRLEGVLIALLFVDNGAAHRSIYLVTVVAYPRTYYMATIPPSNVHPPHDLASLE